MIKRSSFKSEFEYAIKTNTVNAFIKAIVINDVGASGLKKAAGNFYDFKQKRFDYHRYQELEKLINNEFPEYKDILNKYLLLK